MLFYVASPYSKYERGLVAAFEDVAAACGELIKRGIAVYSPIAHTHPIALYAKMDAYDHKIWMPLDHHMIALGGYVTF